MGMTEADSRSKVLGSEGAQSSSVKTNANHALKGKVVVWKNLLLGEIVYGLQIQALSHVKKLQQERELTRNKKCDNYTI